MREISRTHLRGDVGARGASVLVLDTFDVYEHAYHMDSGVGSPKECLHAQRDVHWGQPSYRGVEVR